VRQSFSGKADQERKKRNANAEQEGRKKGRQEKMQRKGRKMRETTLLFNYREIRAAMNAAEDFLSSLFSSPAVFF
jgi:hypothetical protein